MRLLMGMASQGPNGAGTGADETSVGTVAWSNPGNITAEDGSYATATLTALNEQSHYLKASNYGFTIPTGATIDGVEFEFLASKTAFTGDIVCESAKIGKGGTIGGNEKAASEALTTTDTWILFGGPTDTSGLTLSSTDVNATDFLAVLSCKMTSGGPAGNAQCDHVRVTVYYTEASGPAPRAKFITREAHYVEFFE